MFIDVFVKKSMIFIEKMVILVISVSS